MNSREAELWVAGSCSPTPSKLSPILCCSRTRTKILKTEEQQWILWL